MTIVRFDPLDSLFFRDGSPYQQGETNQSGTASMFPPAPPTLVGAIRAACARALGWKSGNWCENKEICKQLGNGEEDLGKLHFRGPFLVRCKSPSNEDKGKDEKTELLFPAPANLMGKIEKPDDKPGNENDKPTVGPLAWLSPSSNALDCDFGSARLPEVVANPRAEGAKLLCEKDWWITAEGLEQVLQNKQPDEKHLVHQNQLWSKEPRIGIARSDESRTTKEGAMYSPSHIRLKKGVSIAMEVDGLSQECKKELPKQPQPVGGESRACWLHLCEYSLPFPKLPKSKWDDSKEALRYTATALTPIAVPKPPKPEEENYAGLPGRIVSACLPRPVILGGWDSLECRPLPLKPYLAPGSVLFLEAKNEEREKVKELYNHAINGRNVIGSRTEWGFGIVAIGLWKDSQK